MIKIYHQLLLVAAGLLLVVGYSTAADKPTNIAFYYGNEAPIGSLMAYDWVVLQQDQASDARVDLLAGASTAPIAYVSVGEMARSHRPVSYTHLTLPTTPYV